MKMPRYSANLTFLFNELPFLDRFAAAKAAGFDAVEYVCLFDHPVEALAAPLKEHGLAQVLLNVPHGNWAAGERGIAILPERVDEFRESLATTIAYCRALNCRQVNCLAGIRPEGVPDQVLRETFVANLRIAAAALKEAGIRLLIEPINTRDIPGFYLTHTRQAFEVIQEVGSDNLFIQHDLYHMQVMEGDLARTLERYLPAIGHIQVADNPGRHEPGTGEINYTFLLGEIDRLGYAGHVGCEYKPKTTTAQSFGWMKGSALKSPRESSRR
jgi:hydroxypyruvate isomerase